jgi:prepilin-type N-terminal cleavage/methylation domain-containing protein
MRVIEKGFTIIEILVVLAIIGVLATILMVVINPGQQIAKARDVQRETDLYAILSSIYQYSREHGGDLPDTDGDPDTNNFPTSLTCIGESVTCFNLGAAGDAGETMVPVYMPSIPADPKTGSNQDTGYMIYVDSYNRLVASASGETKTIGITQ